MTLDRRVAAYAASAEGQRFPDSVPRVSPSGRWLDATWIMGNDFEATAPLYGAYPPRYIERVLALFPEVEEMRQVLHLFAGCVQPTQPTLLDASDWVRVDKSFDRQPRPSVYADATALPFARAPFRLVLADPPYSKADAVRYGVKMVNRKNVLREVARCHAPGTQLVWLDTVLPMYRKDEWLHYGNITIVRSTNHRYRVAALFERAA